MKNIHFFLFLLLFACTETTSKQEEPQSETKEEQAIQKMPVIFDTDANNEIDDQHALAYLFFNQALFDIKGITVNATKSGGDIEGHYEEAKRVMQLCGVADQIPLYKGANADFETIKNTLSAATFDGNAAVDFIIEEAKKERAEKLVLIPVGKLTNIALALAKAPEIKDNIRIVWLGSNYPEPGEYNQDNDVPSLNYVLEQAVEFEMVTVRYGDPSGSDAVRTTPAQMEKAMPNAGVAVETVTGRHGGQFTTFGDYSISLFNNIELHGDPPSRALFDVVAVAILKSPEWGESKVIPAPIMDIEQNQWQERPENERSITIWENFEVDAIVDDFFASIREAGE